MQLEWVSETPPGALFLFECFAIQRTLASVAHAPPLEVVVVYRPPEWVGGLGDSG